MNNFVDWIDVMGPIWANKKHDRYVLSLENLRNLIKVVRSKRREIIKMEMEMFGKIVSSGKGAEKLVRLAKVNLVADPDCFERSTYQKMKDMVKKRMAAAIP